ncbi:MAG: hypothetical protein HF982_05080 [Desulfobacteraceae bacterium]|nr:hypothetical protein [Desulfobacteraceae bacterium]MBC2718952.1 transposase [Desulfobacteraceae bacterium]
MARQLRIEFEGAYYHILSRGNNQSNIFHSDEDRQDFLYILADMSKRFEVEIYAYVLMDNHYHLLLRTMRPNLSKSMQWLGTRYTRRFNLRNLQSGHLFQGRFKSIIVENDAYLLRLSCYIHRNPLRARIVERLVNYKWSSYRFYAYKKKPPEWLKTGPIFSQVRATKDKQRAYRNKVQRYSDEKESLWEDVKFGLIYGSREFLEYIKDTYLSLNKNGELPQLNQLLKDEDQQALIEKAARLLDCNIDFFRESKRLLENNRDKRDAILYFLWKTGRCSNQKIGELFNITYSSVSRRISHVEAQLKTSDDCGIKRIYKKLNETIKV